MPFVLIDEQDFDGDPAPIFCGVFTSTGKASKIIQADFDATRQVYVRSTERANAKKKREVRTFWEAAKLVIKGQDDGSFIWEYTNKHYRWGQWRLRWVENNKPWPK
jgi:hypothetical protein